MNTTDLLCVLALIGIIILDTIDIRNLLKRKNKDINKNKNKNKYKVALVLYSLVLALSIYFAFDIILSNILR